MDDSKHVENKLYKNRGNSDLTRDKTYTTNNQVGNPIIQLAQSVSTVGACGGEFGGIYLDCDQIALRSFDDLRNYDFVMGHENAMNLGNSVLVSIPNATFLHIWHQSYRTYDAKQWGIHSTFVPFRLAKKYPSLIHIENDTLITPDLGGILDVYYKHYDWSRSYAIHLYTRFIRKTFTLSQFRMLDTALGEIVRMILYGSTTLCSS